MFRNLRKTHDVGEQHRGQRAPAGCTRPALAEELLQELENLVGVFPVGERVSPLELDEAGTFDVVGYVAAVVYGERG